MGKEINSCDAALKSTEDLIDLERHFYQPVQVLAKAHGIEDPEVVRKILDDAGMFLGLLPGQRAINVFAKWLKPSEKV